jgi:hypothetical protein
MAKRITIVDDVLESGGDHLAQESQAMSIQIAPVVKSYDYDCELYRYYRQVPHFVCRDFAADYLVAISQHKALSIYGFDCTNLKFTRPKCGTFLLEDEDAGLQHFNYLSVGWAGNESEKEVWHNNGKVLTILSYLLFQERIMPVAKLTGGEATYDDVLLSLPVRVLGSTPAYTLAYWLIRMMSYMEYSKKPLGTDLLAMLEGMRDELSEAGVVVGKNDHKILTALISLEQKLPKAIVAMFMNTSLIFGEDVTVWDFSPDQDLQEGLVLEDMAIGIGSIHASQGIYTFLKAVLMLLDGEDEGLNVVVKPTATRFANALMEVI